MWPWEHAVAGYFTFFLCSVFVLRRGPTVPEAIVVVIGTQIPDLVDKPLGWTFGVLSSGRSLGHSLLPFAVVAIFGLAVARRLDRVRLVSVLLVGYLVGLLTDVPATALAGDLSRATFLVWPILPSPLYDTEPSMLAHLAQVELADVASMAIACMTLVSIQAIQTWVSMNGPLAET